MNMIVILNQRLLSSENEMVELQKQQNHYTKITLEQQRQSQTEFYHENIKEQKAMANGIKSKKICRGVFRKKLYIFQFIYFIVLNVPFPFSTMFGGGGKRLFKGICTENQPNWGKNSVLKNVKIIL